MTHVFLGLEKGTENIHDATRYSNEPHELHSKQLMKGGRVIMWGEE